MIYIVTTLFRALLICILFNFMYSTTSTAQYYKWAKCPGFINRGASVSQMKVDLHDNVYLIGSQWPQLICSQRYIKCFDSNGMLIWEHITACSSPVSIVPHDVSSDSSGNRYVLMHYDNVPYSYGNGLNILTNYNIVKFNSSGLPVRVTPLPEIYNRIESDSIGNLFISNGQKVRRYSRFGNLQWEYVTGFTHQMTVDKARSTFLYNDSVIIKLNPSGILKYTLVEPGAKIVDAKGRIYVSTPGGLKRYGKYGGLNWIRPFITGSVMVNFAGNIYEFRNDSMFKWSHDGSVLKWQIPELDFLWTMTQTGDLYVGGNYNAIIDGGLGGLPIWNDNDICPFQLPRFDASASSSSGNQTWIGYFSTNGQAPFQAAVYTGQIETSSGFVNNVCTSENLNLNWSYCTNYSSSLLPNNIFTAQVSDLNGNFSNPVNIGSPYNAKLPDTLSGTGNYRIRVISSTPGVSSFPNLSGQFGDPDITIYPNGADISVSGNLSICSGQSIQVDLIPGDPNAMVSWYNGNDYLMGGNQIFPDSSGIYFAQVVNHFCNSRYSDTLFLNVINCPEYYIKTDNGTDVCNGKVVQLFIRSEQNHKVRWLRDDQIIQNETGLQLAVNSSGIFTAVVIDGPDEIKAVNSVEVTNNCSPKNLLNPFDNIQVMNDFERENVLIKLPSINKSNLKVAVFDLSGRQVYQSQGFKNQHQLQLDLSHLISGLYLISVSDGFNQEILKVYLH